MALLNGLGFGELITSFSQLTTYKIFRNLTTEQTTSISRTGVMVPVPKFWSCLLVIWNETSTRLTFEQALDTLNKLPFIVDYAHPNYCIKFNVGANDPMYNYNPNDPTAFYHANLHDNSLLTNPLVDADINIEPAWDLSTGYSEVPVKVGVYDTGINWAHNDFSKNGSNQFENSVIKGGKCYDYSLSFPNGTTSYSPINFIDNDGHGTGASGIIGAIRNNNIGMSGIAGGNATNSNFGVNLFAMKISDDDKFFNDGPITPIKSFISTTADAFFEGASSKSLNDKYFELDVMSCSWQVNQNAMAVDILKDQIIYAARNHVTIVFSAGNGGDAICTLPSSYRDDFLMRVGGSNLSGGLYAAEYYGSNHGCGMDVIAPGLPGGYPTLANNNNNTYSSFGYTSGACPHVAGVSALMLSYMHNNAINQTLLPEDIEQLIQKNSKWGNQGYDNHEAWGLINAGATLNAIKLPNFEVKHFTQSFNNSDAVLENNGVTVEVYDHISTDVNVGANNAIGQGKYTAKVYKVTKQINITQPSGRGVLDVWPLNSISSTYNAHISYNALGLYAGNGVELTWNNSQTQATLDGYIYHFTYDILKNQTVDEWLPASAKNLQGTGKLGLSVYTQSPFTNSVFKVDSDKIKVLLYPNPNQGTFTLEWPVHETLLQIKITDVTGKAVYQTNLPTSHQGKFTISNLGLTEGVYFCEAKSRNGATVTKFIITKP